MVAAAARQELVLNITVQYFENDRYDVGLWCDAIAKFTGKGWVYLLNDSVFALRRFSQMVVEAATLPKADRAGSVLSMAGSTTHGAGFNGSLWIESYYRGFSPAGLDTFVNYSCSAAVTESVRRCQGMKSAKYRNRRCIVEHHEIGLAKQYAIGGVHHLFSADEQNPRKRGKPGVKQMWNQTSLGVLGTSWGRIMWAAPERSRN